MPYNCTMIINKLTLGLVSLILLTSQFTFAQSKPNIIVFMVDDMGWQDTSYPFDTVESAFNKIYHTPNMERLAREGVAFSNAYATPVCTPSRVSLITGMNASQHHVTNWTDFMMNHPTGRKDEQFEEPTWNHNGLSPIPNIPNTVFAKPLTQILKDNGYFTIHAGKAHWASAGTPGSNPHSLGFVVNIAGTSTGRPASYYGKDNFGRMTTDYHGVENLQEYFKQDIYLTEALTREAIKTLDYPIDNKIPFFLNLSHYAVHDPFMEDNRYYQKYLDMGLPKNEAKYASMLEGMDKSLGDIMDYLKERNIDQNTYIIFISDNGGFSMSPPRNGESHTHNRPLRSGKGSIYEGGIRVPLIIKGIKGNQANNKVNTPVIIEDIFPTILEMSKAKKAETPQRIDGKSALPYLTKKKNTTDIERPLVFHIPNKWTTTDGDGFNYRSAIRKGNYKLVHSMRTDSYELFDLANDLGESKDLFNDKQYEAVAKELKSELQNILKENKAPMPKRK